MSGDRGGAVGVRLFSGVAERGLWARGYDIMTFCGGVSAVVPEDLASAVAQETVHDQRRKVRPGERLTQRYRNSLDVSVTRSVAELSASRSMNRNGSMSDPRLLESVRVMSRIGAPALSVLAVGMPSQVASLVRDISSEIAKPVEMSPEMRATLTGGFSPERPGGQ